jgi:hypothetical protein
LFWDEAVISFDKITIALAVHSEANIVMDEISDCAATTCYINPKLSIVKE